MALIFPLLLGAGELFLAIRICSFPAHRPAVARTPCYWGRPSLAFLSFLFFTSPQRLKWRSCSCF